MTPDDLNDRLENHIEVAELQLKRDLRDIVAAAAGQLGNSRVVLAKAEAVGRALDSLVKFGLGDVEAVERAGLDSFLLYERLSTKLVQLKLRGAALLQPKDERLQGSARAILEPELERLLAQARSAVRHHQLGFDRQTATSGGISVVGSSQVIVQSHSPSAQASITVDVQRVAQAVSEFEAAIPWEELKATDAADIRGEIATIRAQLGKSSPGGLIIRESGRTLRSLIENMAASAAYPSVLTAVLALWQAAGLG